jgi:hypothetical protein
VIFTADNQSLDGKMIVDEISTLDMNLEKKSLFIGSINAESKLTATLSVWPRLWIASKLCSSRT